MFLSRGNNNVVWIHNECACGAGSTLTMWHKDVFYYDSHLVGRGFIAVFGQHIFV